MSHGQKLGLSDLATSTAPKGAELQLPSQKGAVPYQTYVHVSQPPMRSASNCLGVGKQVGNSGAGPRVGGGTSVFGLKIRRKRRRREEE